MEMEQVLELIKTVSESNLSSFSYKKGDIHLTLKNEKDKEVIIKEGLSLNPEEGIKNQPISLSKEVDNLEIKSPMVGTFYSAGSEESDPYIKVGDLIKKGQVIGIVEAMKLMNEIESEYDGIVEEILVNNQEIVEFGQRLVKLKAVL